MDDSKIRRYHYLFNRSNDIFNRLENNITLLKSKNSTFIGIILSITSIVFGVLFFLLQNEWTPSPSNKLIIAIYFLLNIIILAMNLFIFIPDEHEELEIFEKNRFDELIKMEEKTLYLDFLYHIRKAYQFNYNKYNNKIKIFKWSTYLFSISTMLLVMMILGNIWGWL